jgi:hypothetical protein
MKQKQKRGIVRRVAVGTFNAWSYSVGLTSLGRTVGRIGGNVGKAADQLRRKQNHRKETFEDAVARLGLDEEDLIRQALIFRKYAVWYFVATMLATAWLAYAPYTSHPVSAVFVTTGIVIVTASKWLTWNFRFCQVRDRDLSCGFWEWFFSPGRW